MIQGRRKTTSPMSRELQSELSIKLFARSNRYTFEPYQEEIAPYGTSTVR